MTTLKDGEKQHKREPGLARAANWFIDVTWSTVWGGLKSVTKVFDAFLIGLSWLPLSPLRQVGLDTAVQRGWLNSVQRLATPKLFQSMSYGFNSSLVQLAMKSAIDNKTQQHMEIVTILLSHGGILSKDSLYSRSLFSNIFLDFDILADHPQWIRTAIQHNAVHDNLKYQLLLKAIGRTVFQKHKIAEQLLDVEQNFFKSIQDDLNTHNELWRRVIEDGSDESVRYLIGCTQKHLLTPQRLEPLFAQRGNMASQRKDISVETFYALEARGFDIEGLLTTIVSEHLHYPKRTHKINSNCISIQASLERNPALKEVVEHAQNTKQNTRLLTSIAPKDHDSSETPAVQRKRKM